jgi:hypothetical protein
MDSTRGCRRTVNGTWVALAWGPGLASGKRCGCSRSRGQGLDGRCIVEGRAASRARQQRCVFHCSDSLSSTALYSPAELNCPRNGSRHTVDVTISFSFNQRPTSKSLNIDFCLLGCGGFVGGFETRIPYTAPARHQAWTEPGRRLRCRAAPQFMDRSDVASGLSQDRCLWYS